MSGIAIPCIHATSKKNSIVIAQWLDDGKESEAFCSEPHPCQAAHVYSSGYNYTQ